MGGLDDETKINLNSSTRPKLLFPEIFCCSVTLHEFHLWNLCFLISSPRSLFWFPLFLNQLRELRPLSQWPFTRVNPSGDVCYQVLEKCWAEAHDLSPESILSLRRDDFHLIDSSGTKLPSLRGHPGCDVRGCRGILLRYPVPLIGAVISSAPRHAHKSI